MVWQEGGQTHQALWGSRQLPPPRAVTVVDDTLRANAALAMLQQGQTLLWRGDYHNARQLLQALTRRLAQRQRAARADTTLLQRFHAGRLQQAQQAALLGRLVIPFDETYRVPLRRAPDAAAAALAAWGEPGGPGLIPLREWLGVIGAWQWRQRGVAVAALDGATVHPHYGVFAPIRQEYLALVAQAPLPTPCATALDLGTGTGVIAAILARRGVTSVVATDVQPQAVACASANLERLVPAGMVDVVQHDLYPPDRRFDLVVCNPPWLPGKVSSPLDAAIYDPDARMLRGFLHGLAAHLTPAGEGWLILSDLAERIGLRAPDALTQLLAQANLAVVEQHQIRPSHSRSRDADDPLHEARAAEITSLWRLRPA